MRVTFRNLGTIQQTELDVRPMTVIIGPNNTSKTYVAYSIYGLWKLRQELGREREYMLVLRRRYRSTSPDKVHSVVVEMLNHYARLFARNLKGFFQDTSGRIFTQTHFVLEPFESELRFIEMTDAKMKDRERYAYILDSLLPRPFLLPAERNAFIITYKLLASRRFKLLREQQRGLLAREALSARQMELFREQGDLRYPTPIEDFLDFLSDIELKRPEPVEVRSKPFRALASDIESKIQGNNKTILVPTALGGQEVKVDVSDDLRIDLYNASSSIKQLAPLLLYLRYQAAPNQLLIIDEPEMNLHPEGQAKLLEALAILVNLGVHVLITTHSPYFMAHLNNLVAGDMKRPAVRKRQAQSLYMTDPRAFLSMDQVSAYEMKDNQLCSLKDEAHGIRWDTLSDVSVELQQRFFAIQEAGQARRGKKK